MPTSNKACSRYPTSKYYRYNIILWTFLRVAMRKRSDGLNTLPSKEPGDDWKKKISRYSIFYRGRFSRSSFPWDCLQVVDASVALDSARRSMYDPDELDEEQRERHLRKKLNEMSSRPCVYFMICPFKCCANHTLRLRFKEFCKKMERVAKQHHYDLERKAGSSLHVHKWHYYRFDIPYRDLGFHGVPNREMVLIQPTVHCLVNLTETPFFIVELDHVRLSSVLAHLIFRQSD